LHEPNIPTNNPKVHSHSEERLAQTRGEDQMGLKKNLKIALTRTECKPRRGGKIEKIELTPSRRLLYSLYFAIAFLTALVILELGHMAILRTWNSEAFAAITGLAGTVTGVFQPQKA